MDDLHLLLIDSIILYKIIIYNIQTKTFNIFTVDDTIGHYSFSLCFTDNESMTVNPYTVTGVPANDVTAECSSSEHYSKYNRTVH